MKFWPIADLLLLLTNEWRRPPLYIVGLMVIPGITFLWATDPLAPLLFSLRIYLIWSLVASGVRRSPLLFWVATSVAINLLGIYFNAPSFGEFRFDGVDSRYSFQYDNPELLGLAGLVLFPTLGTFFGALAIGFAGARAALLAVAIWTVLNLHPFWIVSLLLAGLVLYTIRPEAFTLEETSRTLDQRIETVYDPTEIAPTVADNRIIKLGGVPDELLGYGYHSFNDRTGFQTPHNIFFLVFRELGPILSTGFWTLLIGGLLGYMRHWKLIVPILVYVLFTDSLWYFPAGHYAVLFLILMKGPALMNKEVGNMDDDDCDDGGEKIVNSEGVNEDKQQ